MDDKDRIFNVSEAGRELGLSAEWLRQGEKRALCLPHVGIGEATASTRPRT